MGFIPGMSWDGWAVIDEGLGKRLIFPARLQGFRRACQTEELVPEGHEEGLGDLIAISLLCLCTAWLRGSPLPASPQTLDVPVSPL